MPSMTRSGSEYYLHRALTGHVSAGHGEPVPPVVQAPRFRRLLQPQRPTDLHHQRRPEDVDGRRIAEGCPRTRWTLEPSNHAEVHQGESPSSGPHRGIGSNEGPVWRLKRNMS